MILRPFQQILVDRCRASMAAGKRSPLLVSPCGSGKTVMFSYFAKTITSKNKRTLILCHRDELLDQISRTLSGFQVRHGMIASGRFHDPRHNVQVGSVFSVVRRLARLRAPDVIIIDEAHHSLASTFVRIFNAFPKAWKIGVTATPCRLSGEALGDVFDDLIIGPGVKELTQAGFLSPYRLFIPSGINTSGVHSRGGDFAMNELTKISDKPSITGSAIVEYRKYADHKRAVVFCCSVSHAQHVAEQFSAAGYRAMSIDGTLDRDERRKIVNDFRSGQIEVLTSCSLIDEGFDLPAIEVAIILRPTQSLARWIQMAGRALRIHPGKSHAIILDHSSNTINHGLPDEDRVWTLEGRQGRSGPKSSESVSVKVCGRCFAAMPAGLPTCKFCGFQFPIKPRKIDEKEGELSEVDVETIRRNRMKEQGGAESMEDLYRIGVSRGYKFPRRWAMHVHQARQARKLGRV